MATLAAMLREGGHAVGGSDRHVYPPMSDFLATRGIPCRDGFDASHIAADVDVVVIGNAVSRGNPEVEAVLDRGLRYCSLPEMVRETWLWDRRSIVVAGTHGKTTTSSLIAWLLTEGGRDPSFLIGGVTGNFDSTYRLGRGREFVIEGDEYDSAFFDKTAKFLKYLPDLAVVGNLEFDHADIYADFEAIRLAVRRFVTLLPRRGLLLVGADSPAALEAGAGRPARWRRSGSRATQIGGRARSSRARKERRSRSSIAALRSAGYVCRWSVPSTCGTRSRRSRRCARSVWSRPASPPRSAGSRGFAGVSRSAVASGE